MTIDRTRVAGIILPVMERLAHAAYRSERYSEVDAAHDATELLIADGFEFTQITVLRDLQLEYIEKRNHCFSLIRKQDNDPGNCMPSASTIRACREREDELRAEAAQHQKRIDAIQKKIDEAIGLTDG